MKDQIQSKPSVARHFLQGGSPVRLMMAGILLVAISALLPMPEILKLVPSSTEKDAQALAASEVSQAEAKKGEWELAKRDPATLKALREEWLAAKQKFDAEFGVVARLNAEAALAYARQDEWERAKHDPVITKELQEQWRAVKQAFAANFGASLTQKP